MKLLAWTLDWRRLVETSTRSSSTAHVTLLASSVIWRKPVQFVSGKTLWRKLIYCSS